MALAGTGAILYLLWLGGAFLPCWVQWKNRDFGDASGEYRILLEKRKAAVESGGDVIWASPEGVLVQDCLSRDIDHDGEDELVMLVWKRGRYGRARPFWVDEEETSWSQHLFVYEYNCGDIHAKWMSSYMGTDVASLDSGRGADACERLFFTDPGGKESCWRWDSWGFAREEAQVSFAVFGDNLIHEPIYRYGLNRGGAFDFLYEKIKAVLSERDITVINQETPLTDDPDAYSGYPRFGTPAQVGQAIADAGFDVVTCATNHALDRGAEGVGFTEALLESRGVACIGIQSVAEKEYVPYEVIRRNNIRIAMLNYTYGTNGLQMPEESPYMVHMLGDGEQVKKDIRDAKAESDIVIVFVHWGTEYSSEPDGFQRRWTRIFLESGVDVVVGTHPHVLQPFEMLEDDKGHEMLVYYSIGNFVSAQREDFCVRGGMADFTVSLTPDGYRITEYGLRPLAIMRDKDGRIRAGFLADFWPKKILHFITDCAKIY